MTAFLAEVGTKLADRWVAALLAPGLLLVTAITIAARLGQAHALDIGRLRDWISSTAADPGSRSPGTLLLAAAGVLAAAAVAGLAAAALGKCVERAWTLPGRRPPGRYLVAWRLRRWHNAGAVVASAKAAVASAEVRRPGPPAAAIPDLGAAIARQHAICLVEPARPTWIGDRLRAADLRVHRAYDLDLGAAWPRLWTLAPDHLRADIAAAQDAYSTAARLTGWGLLYALLGGWWWPAAPIGILILGTAWSKARGAADALADLAETTVDLHGLDLARQLGILCDGQLTPGIGHAVTVRLRKDDTLSTLTASHTPAAHDAKTGSESV